MWPSGASASKPSCRHWAIAQRWGFEHLFLGETNMKKSMVPVKPIEMPEEFQRFFDLPAMVGDETHQGYLDFSREIEEAVGPIDIFDWIWAGEFVLAEWNIRRNRRLKDQFIAMKEQEYLEERKREVAFNRYRIGMLRNRMVAEADAENPGDLKHQDNKKEAMPEIAETEVADIEDPYLRARILVQWAEIIDTFDRWIAADEKKRDGVLREIDRRRESLARRLEKASSEIIDAEFTEAAE
jgi:hypothetical protein